MMNAPRWRALLVALLMLASAGAAVLGRPTKHMADQVGMPDLEAMFPRAFGTWRVDTSMPVILPSPDVQALLDKIYNQVLSRTYVNAEGQRIMLSVAYGGDQSDGTSAHRPEVCYPAQGFAITVNRMGSVPLGQRQLPVRQLMSQLGPRKEPITYWVTVGGEVVTTGIGQKLAQMRYGVRGIIADGMLVRVSSIDNDMAGGHRLQALFISDLVSHMDAASAARVFGRAGS
ncbi:MAG: EpsI family protein [Burkholderiaceae bacterium]|nr:EpsI family protein [Burkholderiaceae bacterium]